MPDPIIIESDTNLSDIEHHFRVCAGPGAGKTHWLINHIRNVVRNSNRLSSTSRIACISYTNVAVEEIVDRLDQYAEHVESSTIHSFLYRNVVKPYLHLLKNDDGHALVDYAQVDGHDEHHPSITIVREWLKSFNAKFDLFGNKADVINYLKHCKWVMNETNGNWSFKTIGLVKRIKYFPTSELDSYKSYYWKEGIIDHEDVLYFAYRVLNENPLIRTFLSARFPYIFIDEFQDTNPVQTKVVKWLASETTIVGVIGDVEQAIYSFQGARYDDFKEFNPGNLQEYKIKKNRRSTDRIIDLLNKLRNDGLNQIGYRNVEGAPVTLYVGSVTDTISKIKSELPKEKSLIIIARRNDEVQSIRRKNPSKIEDIWSELENVDRDRRRFLEFIICASELAKQKTYSFAFKKLIQGLKKKRNGELRKPLKIHKNYDVAKIDDIQFRALAVTLLEFLITEYDRIADKTVLQIYLEIRDKIEKTIEGLSLTDVKAGKFHEYADALNYIELASSVNLSSSEKREIRTIHQAKGTQFKNLLLSLNHLDSKKAQKQLDFILNPTDGDPEEKRIYYVALSRAEDRLFISIPKLKDNKIQQLEALDINVIKLP
jgi:DNA helicase-2/ATP-dependent DNA helicase PcrA